MTRLAPAALALCLLAAPALAQEESSSDSASSVGSQGGWAFSVSDTNWRYVSSGTQRTPTFTATSCNAISSGTTASNAPTFSANRPSSAIASRAAASLARTLPDRYVVFGTSTPVPGSSNTSPASRPRAVSASTSSRFQPTSTVRRSSVSTEATNSPAGGGTSTRRR